MLVLLVTVLVTAGLAAWLLVDASRARGALERAAGSLPGLREQVESGAPGADDTVRTVRDEAAAAVAATSGPHWRVAGALPFVGDDARALAEVASVVDDVATDALPRLASAAVVADPSRFPPRDGRVDLAPLEAARDDVVGADETVASALERVSAIDTGTLVGPLRDAVDQLGGQLADVRASTATASRAVQLLPPMLGADGARDYLVLVQNNAEPRAEGGISGSVLHLRTEDGAITFVEQRPGKELGGYEESVVDLTGPEQALFGTDLGRHLLNVTSTPDFPRAAELASAIWREQGGSDVDGVLAVDPVALAGMLAATGPVVVATSTGESVTLTADDAAAYLLNGVYREHPEPSVQDALFGAAAHGVFDALVSGQADPAAAVDALAGAAREGRLLVWSAHPDEQSLLTGTVLSGELRGVLGGAGGAGGEDWAPSAGQPVVGVYLNASSAAKVGYYLDTDVVVTDVACRPDGSQSFTLEVTLTSALAADEAADLPDYVTGDRDGDGTIRTNLLVYAPRHGGILGSDATVGDPGLFAQVHDDLVVGGRSVALAPEESATFRYEMVSGKNQTGAVVVRSTPGARSASSSIPASSCASQGSVLS